MKEPVECKVCGVIGQRRRIKAGNVKTEVALWLGPLLMLVVAIVAFVATALTMDTLNDDRFIAVKLLMSAPWFIWPCAIIYSAYRRIRAHDGCRSCGSEHIDTASPRGTFAAVSQ